MAVESLDRHHDCANNDEFKASCDVNPYINKWCNGESPRGRYDRGLPAVVDGDPYVGALGYRFGFGYSGGHEHEMGDTSADDSTHPGNSSDLDFVSSLPDWDALNADNENSSNEVNVWRGDIRTDIAEQAARYLGLLQGTNDDARLTTPTSINSPSHGLTSARIKDGKRLVEVFSVRINPIDNNDYKNYCGDLCGAVRVQHNRNFSGAYLYNRQQTDSKCISLYDDTLSLVGPPGVIYFCDFFRVTLDLKDKDGDLFPPDDSNRSFGRHFTSMYYFEYGRLMSEEFHGEFGSATVYYTIFEYAVQARVEVEVVKGDRVYGNIVARYADYDYSIARKQMKYYQSVLFHKPRSNYVKVKLRKVIPLSRPVVAVPTSSSLIIEASLWNHSELNHDDRIAKGTVVFPPQAKGETVMDIKGDNGIARVTVAWSTVY